METTKHVAISYSKLRNEIGLVGIEVRENETKPQLAHVKLVRHWKSDQINEIVTEITSLYQIHQWDNTIIEQETGEYLIQMLKSNEIPISVITTQKKVKDPKEIQKIRVMDKIEMAEFLRQLKINEQIKFPKNPSENMLILEKQIPFFSKHTTEAGGIDYYTPGTEPDNLVKGLMIACFSIRNLLTDYNDMSYCRPLEKDNSDQNMDISREMMALSGQGGDIYGY